VCAGGRAAGFRGSSLGGAGPEVDGLGAAGRVTGNACWRPSAPMLVPVVVPWSLVRVLLIEGSRLSVQHIYPAHWLPPRT
jgi:hypothetical protein